MPAPNLNPVYGPPNRVTCIPCYDGLFVATIYDPAAVGQKVTVTLNGVTYTSDGSAGTAFTLTKRGNVCWTGKITPTVPSGFRSYPWAASQTVSGTTWTDNGTYWTRPGFDDDFVVFIGTCDNNSNFSDSTAIRHKANVAGYWQYAKSYAETGALRAPYCIIAGDVSYVDTKIIADNGSVYVQANQSGLVTPNGVQPATNATAFTYAEALDAYLIAWCAAVGMLGPEQTSYTDAELTVNSTSYALLYVLWGRETNRAWCRKNINQAWQVDDHEYVNDLGWNVLTTVYPNPRFLSAGVDGAGQVAWNAFGGLMAPPSAKSTDTVANHWTMTLGPACFAGLDRISSAVGNTLMEYTTPATVTAVYGNAQIVDVLNAVYTHAKPFTFFVLPVTLRYFKDAAPYTLATYGAQHPIYNHCRSEFQRLITDNTHAGTTLDPKSLLHDDRTNGKLGCVTFFAGDHHFGQALKYVAPASGNDLAENFYEVHLGTINRSINFASADLLAEGQTTANMTCEYAQSMHPDLGMYETGNSGSFHMVRIEVYGSHYPKEAHAKLQNHEDTTMWGRQLVQYRGNYGLALTDSVPQPPTMSAGVLSV